MLEDADGLHQCSLEGGSLRPSIYADARCIDAVISYLGEFLEMLPCLMSPSTCIEVLHTILDLPVLSAALEHSRSGSVDAISSATPIAGALINYIMREEGGLGGTIDRLEVLHELMADFSGRQRVQVAAQIVPTLLRVFFISVAKEASYVGRKSPLATKNLLEDTDGCGSPLLSADVLLF